MFVNESPEQTPSSIDIIQSTYSHLSKLIREYGSPLLKRAKRKRPRATDKGRGPVAGRGRTMRRPRR
jgi:hypothetical protein